MQDLLFTLEFIGGLIVFFYVLSLAARLLKLADNIEDHQPYYLKRIHRVFNKESEYTIFDKHQKQEQLN